MTRINTTPEVKDNKNILLANDMLVKSPNGRMFLKPEKMYDNTFISAVIKKDVEIVGGTTPEVWVEDTEGTTLSNDNKKYSRKKITEVTNKEVYTKETPDCSVTYEFLDKMTIANIKAWALKRDIKVPANYTKKDTIIKYVLKETGNEI